MSNNPAWVDAIREGRFTDAEDQFRQSANQQAQILQAQQDWEAVNEQHGNITQFIKLNAASKVDKLAKEGKIQTPQQFSSAYRQAMQEEAASFNRTYSGGKDPEYTSYIDERKAQERARKGLL